MGNPACGEVAAAFHLDAVETLERPKRNKNYKHIGKKREKPKDKQ
jgi:hypothetical protein